MLRWYLLICYDKYIGKVHFAYFFQPFFFLSGDLKISNCVGGSHVFIDQRCCRIWDVLLWAFSCGFWFTTRSQKSLDIKVNLVSPHSHRKGRLSLEETCVIFANNKLESKDC